MKLLTDDLNSEDFFYKEIKRKKINVIIFTNHLSISYRYMNFIKSNCCMKISPKCVVEIFLSVDSLSIQIL
jgi:hypothetical protein